jgi:protease-4
MAKQNNRLILWLLAFTALFCIVTTVGFLLLLDGGVDQWSDEEQWLHVRITPGIVESPGSEGLIMDPADLPPLTTELAAAITDAATDPQIAGLLLEIEGTGGGWAQVQELREAIWQFRDEGKPSIAWAETYGNSEYFLASAATEIHLAPEGLALVNGLYISKTYFAGLFEKLGVTANFEHVGDFKSAVEPYERTGPSDAAKAATNALLDSIYGQLQAGIAQGRDITPEAVSALIDNPPITPKAAKKRGLVDSLTYRDELEEHVGAKLKKVSQYLASRRGIWSGSGTQIAVIHAEGTIVGGNGGAGSFGGQMIGSKSMSKLIKKIRDNDDFAAVVLRINSPGGSGMASDTIWRELMLTQNKKPIVVSMGDYAASGGYYIAMGADHIVAQPGTITGSIGVFGGKMNLSGLKEQIGLTTHSFERGARADLFSSDTDFDPKDRAKFRQFLNNFYKTFVTKAAQGRGMSYEALEAVAQGRVWTGEQALELKLVDSLGGLDDAITIATQLASIDGDVSIVRFPERKGFVDQLLDELTNPEPVAGVSLAALALPESADELKAALSEAIALEQVLTDGGPVVMLPGNMAIR